VVNTNSHFVLLLKIYFATTNKLMPIPASIAKSNAARRNLRPMYPVDNARSGNGYTHERGNGNQETGGVSHN
jgi:hypothetical protein